MRKVLSAIVLIVCLFLSGAASAFESDPDGFLGVKWGTDISEVQGMKKVRTDADYSEVDIYSRPGDELKFGDAALKSIEYHFWRGKFFSAVARVTSESNYIALVGAAFAKFGPTLIDEKTGAYNWRGGTAKVAIAPGGDYGSITIKSVEISAEFEKYRRQKQKEAPDTIDGFRGIKWGTKIETLKGMTRTEIAPDDKSFSIYTRKGDEMRYGDAVLKSIEYNFRNGKFTAVIMSVEGEANYKALKDAAFKKFGWKIPDEDTLSAEKFEWSGAKTIVVLGQYKDTDSGALMFASAEITKEIEEYERKKEKETEKTP